MQLPLSRLALRATSNGHQPGMGFVVNTFKIQTTHCNSTASVQEASNVQAAINDTTFGA